MPDPSLILPEALVPQRVVPQSRQTVRRTQALSGHIHTRRQGAQLWDFRLSYPPMDPALFAPVMAFLAGRGGRDGVFYVKIPDLVPGPKASLGQFINFTGYERLYMVTGLAPLTVTPDPVGIVEGLSESLIAAETYLRCSLASDVQSFESDQKGLYRYELSVTERLVL